MLLIVAAAVATRLMEAALAIPSAAAVVADIPPAAVADIPPVAVADIPPVAVAATAAAATDVDNLTPSEMPEPAPTGSGKPF